MISPRRGTPALARATGDYAFWLDADDVIEPPEREKLRSSRACSSIGLRAATGGSTVPAYVVEVRLRPGRPDGGGGETVVDHIRLFPVGETSAGPIASTSRSCRRCGGPASRCDGPT